MSETALSNGLSTGLFDRTLRRIGSLWRNVSGANGESESTETQMRACLEGRGGEVSARSRAARLAETYLQQDADGRIEFLRRLG